MITINPFKTTALLLVSLSVQLAGQAQVYQLSTPISGSMTMDMTDLAGPTGSSGSTVFTLNSLTETVYIDPVAETIRQVGSISVAPSGQDIVINETQQAPSPFPNPPHAAPGSITIYVAPSGGNIMSFDTGPQPVTWNSASQNYTFDGTIYSFLTPISASYSLVTGGQTYSGTVSYTLAFNGQGTTSYSFGQLDTGSYPTAISLNGLGNGYEGGVFSSQPSVVADVTAANGFHMPITLIGAVINRSLRILCPNLLPFRCSASARLHWPFCAVVRFSR
jgi:hypothetical protein